MKGDSDRVMMCTTGQFDGSIALINPQTSWVVSSSLLLSYSNGTRRANPCVYVLTWLGEMAKEL